MSKVAHYLQEHILGEIMTGTDARRYFSTDASIMQLPPSLVVYPRNENDIRKIARFAWQLAERGRVIPLTIRGSGTDQTGASLTEGILIVTPAHMNKILEIDNKNGTATVQPGLNFGRLDQTLHTHGRYIPVYPSSYQYSTIGGALANNATGVGTFKYGPITNYVASLRVVLANGEVIETTRLSKKEVSRKLGLATFEGEIYRSVDSLFEEKADLIDKLDRNVEINNAGYNLNEVRGSDGSIDLTPLFVGSQGTLGMISEAVMQAEFYSHEKLAVLVGVTSLEQLNDITNEIAELKEKPSSFELINQHVIEQAIALNPNQLKDILNPPFSSYYIIMEFNGMDKSNARALKRTKKILAKYTEDVVIAEDEEDQEKLDKLMNIIGILLGHNEGGRASVPLIDGSIPSDKIAEYIKALLDIMKSTSNSVPIFGSLGLASFRMICRLDLSQIGDLQKAFRIIDENNKLVIKLGGSISSALNDGRLKTPYLEAMYGAEAYALLAKVKNIFDPYNVLNPGVKFKTSLEDIKAMTRSSYNVAHAYNHITSK